MLNSLNDIRDAYILSLVKPEITVFVPGSTQDILRLQLAIDKNTEAITILQNAVGSGDAMAEVKAQVSKNTENITKLGYTVSVVQSDVSRLEGTVANAQGHLSYLNGKVDENTSDIEGLRSDIQNEAHFRGYLQTNAEVQALQGTPNDYAYSAESGTVWIYQNGAWVNSGKPVPDQMTPASNATPLIDGTPSVGTENAYARGDHRHPTDTSRMAASEKGVAGGVATLDASGKVPKSQLPDDIGSGGGGGSVPEGFDPDDYVKKSGDTMTGTLEFNNGIFPEWAMADKDGFSAHSSGAVLSVWYTSKGIKVRHPEKTNGVVYQLYYPTLTQNETLATESYVDDKISKIEFIEIVSSLPETGEANKYYLVTKTDGGEEGDLFDAYIWVNDKWEFEGTKQASVDLSVLEEYVKNTDYASTSKAGIFIVGEGLSMSSTTHKLSVNPATDAQIEGGTGAQSAITVGNMKKAVKVGITTNTETLTDEEKTSACDWIGATPYPSKLASQYTDTVLVRKSTGEWVGVMADAGDGIAILASGRLIVSMATTSQIEQRLAKPLSTQLLDYAVRESLSNCKIDWDDEQKADARTLLGINGASKRRARIVISDVDFLEMGSVLLIDTYLAVDEEELFFRTEDFDYTGEISETPTAIGFYYWLVAIGATSNHTAIHFLIEDGEATGIQRDYGTVCANADTYGIIEFLLRNRELGTDGYGYMDVVNGSMPVVKIFILEKTNNEGE